MTTAVPPDPFEEEWAALSAQLADLDFGPFGYTDPRIIDAEVAKFAEYLESTPTAEREC